MARFNKPNSPSNLTQNPEGDKAYRLPAELELVSHVSTSLIAPQFYRGVGEGLRWVIELAGEVDLSFLARLAVYARREMNMRSITTLLLKVMIDRFGKSKLKDKGLAISAIAAAMLRVDDMTELAALFIHQDGRLRPVPAILKRGLRYAIEIAPFKAYHYAKYDRRDRAVRPRDLIRLVRPHPRSGEQSELFRDLSGDKLPAPDTWEVALSRAGQRGEEKRETWGRLIREDRIPIFALIRNLRNMLEAGIADPEFELVAAKLADENIIRRSRLFPYRFFEAYRALMASHESLDLFRVDRLAGLLEKAAMTMVGPALADAFTRNGEPLRILIAVDISGSMDSRVSDRSETKAGDIGLVLGGLMAAAYPDKALVMTFEGDAQLHGAITAPFKWAKSIRLNNGTRGDKIFARLSASKTRVDRVIVFSDQVIWSSDFRGEFESTFRKYRDTISPKMDLILVDLTGYGTTPVQLGENSRVKFVSGWSENVFRALAMLERGEGMVETIKRYEIPIPAVAEVETANDDE